MSIPSRMEDRILVLSKLKQATYTTLVTDVNLQGGKRVPPMNALFGQPDISRWTNRDLSMQGQDYATQVQETMRDLKDSLQLIGDPWLLAWAFAFAMGKVTTTGPVTGAYTHVIKPLDPSSDGKDLPVTTIYSEVNTAANLKRRLESMCIRGVSLEFPADAPVRVTCDLVGSGKVTTGALASPPAMMTLIPLMSNDMSFLYGTQAAPTDISSQIVRGSVKFGFTWNMDDQNSRAPGGGLYRSRAWVGRPEFSLEFQRFVDDALATPNDDWLADTIQEVKFSVAGPLIGGIDFNRIEVRGLAVVPQVVKLGQAGDKTVYQYTIGPDHWLKQGAADVATVTIENTETSFLV